MSSDKRRKTTILLGANGRRVIDLGGISVADLKKLKPEDQKVRVDEILDAIKGKRADKEKPLKVDVKKGEG